jgi:hypothetical protein
VWEARRHFLSRKLVQSGAQSALDLLKALSVLASQPRLDLSKIAERLLIFARPTDIRAAVDRLGTAPHPTSKLGCTERTVHPLRVSVQENALEEFLAILPESHPAAASSQPEARNSQFMRKSAAAGGADQRWPPPPLV